MYNYVNKLVHSVDFPFRFIINFTKKITFTNQKQHVYIKLLNIFILVLGFQYAYAQGTKNVHDNAHCKQGYWELHEGRKLMRGNYLNDVKIGLWEKMDKKGRLSYKEYYDTLGNGLLDSLIIYKKGIRYTGRHTQLEPNDEEQNKYLESKGNVINGIKEGKWVTYYRGNKIKEMVLFKKGKKNGFYEKFDIYGNIIKSGTYKNDLKEGVWKHYKRWHYYHKEPIIKRKFTFREDQLHGQFISYYNNTDIQLEGTYFYNQKHGQWINNRRTSKRINNFNLGTLDGNQDWLINDSLVTRFIVHDNLLMDFVLKGKEENINTDSFSNGNGIIKFNEISLNSFLFNSGALPKSESIKLFKDDIYNGSFKFKNGKIADGKYILHRYFANDNIELIIKNGQFLVYNNTPFFDQKQLIKFSESVQLIYQKATRGYDKTKGFEYHTINQISMNDSLVIISQTKDSSYNVRSKKKFFHNKEVRYYIYPKHLVRQGLDIDSTYFNEYFGLKGIKSFRVKKERYPIYRFVNKYKNIEGTEDIYWNPELGIINNYFTSWGDYVTLKKSSINNEAIIIALNKLLVKDYNFFGWKLSQ